MKVEVECISPQEEEIARLYVHEKNFGVTELVKYIKGGRYQRRKIICYEGESGQQTFIPCEEIFVIETFRDTTYVYDREKEYTSKLRLYELEEILPENFVRISRSSILNIEQVKKYIPMLNGLMKVELLNEKEAYISRKYLKQCRDQIRRMAYEK